MFASCCLSDGDFLDVWLLLDGYRLLTSHRDEEGDQQEIGVRESGSPGVWGAGSPGIQESGGPEVRSQG